MDTGLGVEALEDFLDGAHGRRSGQAVGDGFYSMVVHSSWFGHRAFGKVLADTVQASALPPPACPKVPVCTNFSYFYWANNPEGILKLMMGLKIPKIQFSAQSAFFPYFLHFITQLCLNFEVKFIGS